MPFRTSETTLKQHNAQVGYMSLLEECVSLHEFLRIRSSGPARWYLESNAFNKSAGASSNTENRVNWITASRTILFVRKEFTDLLANVQILEALSEEQFDTVFSEHCRAASSLTLPDKERMAEVFCIIYSELRKADGLGSTNFVDADLLALSLAEQYLFISTHVKKSIVDKNQSRSVDSWLLMQKVLNGRLTLDQLAQVIHGISGTRTRRGSVVDTSRESLAETTRGSILGSGFTTRSSEDVRNHLMLSAYLLKPLTEQERQGYFDKLSPVLRSSSDQLALQAAADRAVLDMVASMDLNSHPSWLPPGLLLSAIGIKIADAIKEAVVGGSGSFKTKFAWAKGGTTKEAREETFNPWYDHLVAQLCTFLGTEKLQVAPAVGLYFFCKENKIMINESLIGELALATDREAEGVVAYLDGFMPAGVTAREAHKSLIAAQLGINLRLEVITANSTSAERYDGDIKGVCDAFVNLVALMQTPFRILLATEEVAKIRAKLLHEAPKTSALDLELGSTSKSIRQHLMQLAELKKNEDAKLAIAEIVTALVKDMSTVVAALGFIQREEKARCLEEKLTVVTQQLAEAKQQIITLSDENAALKAELAQYKLAAPSVASATGLATLDLVHERSESDALSVLRDVNKPVDPSV